MIERERQIWIQVKLLHLIFSPSVCRRDIHRLSCLNRRAFRPDLNAETWQKEKKSVNHKPAQNKTWLVKCPALSVRPDVNVTNARENKSCLLPSIHHLFFASRHTGNVPVCAVVIVAKHKSQKGIETSMSRNVICCRGFAVKKTPKTQESISMSRPRAFTATRPHFPHNPHTPPAEASYFAACPILLPSTSYFVAFQH